MTIEKAPRLTSLQALRFIAAANVVLFHLHVIPYYPRAPFSFFDFNLLSFFSVDFFFVLSGYVTLLVHLDDIGRPERVSSFLFKRITRIYPSYWLIMTVLVPVFLLQPGFGQHNFRSFGFIMQCIFLLPTSTQPILLVSWTLQHELLFCVMFALAIYSRTIGVTILLCWLVFSGFLGSSSQFPLSVLFSPYHYLFLFGMTAAWITRRVRLPNPTFLMGVSLVGLFLIFALYDTVLNDSLHQAVIEKPNMMVDYPLLIPIGFAFSLMFVAFAQMERDRDRLAFFPPALVKLGDISYTLYLLHFPLIVCLAKILRWLGITAWMPSEVIALALFFVAVGASTLFHKWVEKPLSAIFRHASSRNLALSGVNLK